MCDAEKMHLLREKWGPVARKKDFTGGDMGAGHVVMIEDIGQDQVVNMAFMAGNQNQRPFMDMALTLASPALSMTAPSNMELMIHPTTDDKMRMTAGL